MTSSTESSWLRRICNVCPVMASQMRAVPSSPALNRRCRPGLQRTLRTDPAWPRRTWLAGFRLTKRANLAAPGLTLHGKASAIDFQVMKDGQIIAGANSRQIEPVWQADGWDVKLKDSITAAGPSFHGPLERPFEPWHFDYKPGQALAPSAGTGSN